MAGFLLLPRALRAFAACMLTCSIFHFLAARWRRAQGLRGALSADRSTYLAAESARARLFPLFRRRCCRHRAPTGPGRSAEPSSTESTRLSYHLHVEKIWAAWPRNVNMIDDRLALCGSWSCCESGEYPRRIPGPNSGRRGIGPASRRRPPSVGFGIAGVGQNIGHSRLHRMLATGNFLATPSFQRFQNQVLLNLKLLWPKSGH